MYINDDTVKVWSKSMPKRARRFCRKIQSYLNLAYNSNINFENNKKLSLSVLFMCHKCSYCNILKLTQENSDTCRNVRCSFPFLNIKHFHSLPLHNYSQHTDFMNYISKCKVCFQVTVTQTKHFIKLGLSKHSRCKVRYVT